jgi:hypothetical protein
LWIQAQQQLIGFGVAAEDVIPIFSALQDGVVAVGGSAQSSKKSSSSSPRSPRSGK